MKVFTHLKLISIKNRMLADFYIPRLSHDMKIVQKNNFVAQILYRSLVPSKKTASLLYFVHSGQDKGCD
mgnify:CR=1 FL=1